MLNNFKSEGLHFERYNQKKFISAKIKGYNIFFLKLWSEIPNSPPSKPPTK